jgi:hypothetical protein
MPTDGWEVEPADLRAGAAQVRAASQPLHTAHVAATGQIGAAVAMNVGYETAAALRHFARSVRDLSRRAQDRIDEHVDALQRSADNYEDTDRRNEEPFMRYLRG